MLYLSWVGGGEGENAYIVLPQNQNVKRMGGRSIAMRLEPTLPSTGIRNI